MTRIIPDLPKAKAHWEHRSSDIPDFIMVPMSDGRVIRFNPEIEQPGFIRAMDNLKSIQIGYQWKGENDESTL